MSVGRKVGQFLSKEDRASLDQMIEENRSYRFIRRELGVSFRTIWLSRKKRPTTVAAVA